MFFRADEQYSDDGNMKLLCKVGTLLSDYTHLSSRTENLKEMAMTASNMTTLEKSL